MIFKAIFLKELSFKKKVKKKFSLIFKQLQFDLNRNFLMIFLKVLRLKICHKKTFSLIFKQLQFDLNHDFFNDFHKKQFL